MRGPFGVGDCKSRSPNLPEAGANGLNFFKIENADDLKAALEKLPGRELTVMQFLDGCGADGKIRKYRVMMIAVKSPLHAAISHQWKIHYVTAEMADCPEHLTEDEAFLNAMTEVIGKRAMAALEGIRDVLGLDYEGADFSLNQNGDVLLFEANSTMVVTQPRPHEQWAYRRAPVERIFEATRAMLARKAAGRLEKTLNNLSSADDYVDAGDGRDALSRPHERIG